MTDEQQPSTEVDVPRELVLVSSGERVPATRENAYAVIDAARERKRGLDEIIRDATAYLVDESRRQGTKTFHTDAGKVELKGGETTEYDPLILREALQDADCPEERINEVIRTKVEEKVDLRILKQLTAANAAYAAAAEKAALVIDRPVSVSLGTPRQRRTP